MASGYIIIPRNIFEDKVFKKGKANETFAFIDLVQMAEYQDTFINIKGQILSLSRGDLAASIRFLSDRWGWSINAVTRTLDTLEKYCKIKRRKSNLTSIISIVDYDQYQTLGNADSNAKGITKSNADKDKIKYNKDIKDNKVNIKKELKEKKGLVFPFSSECFMAVWNDLVLQPKWKGKSESALQLSLNKLSKYDEAFAIQLMEMAIERGWAGVVFDDTNERYKQWKNGGLGTKVNDKNDVNSLWNR